MEQWKVVARNIGPTFFSADVRGHKVFGDVPPELGGNDAAPIPPETLLTALGNCMGMVIALTCKAKGVAYEGMELDVTADVVDGGARLDNFVVTIRMAEKPDDRARQVIENAESLCKVANTLMHGADVKVTIE